MLNEIMAKFPEMIQALLQKVSQTELNESPARRAAREKLISDLQSITTELAKVSSKSGEMLTEEQMKQILSIPRLQSQNIGAFLPPITKGGNKI